MNTIRELAIEARAKAQKELENFIHQHNGFSGSEVKTAEIRMGSFYTQTLWQELVSLVRKTNPAEIPNPNLERLLLELYVRGVDIDPTHLSSERHWVIMENTDFELTYSSCGEIKVALIPYIEDNFAFKECLIADMMIVYNDLVTTLPDCYYEVSKKLLKEKKEAELLEATAKGLAHFQRNTDLL